MKTKISPLKATLCLILSLALVTATDCFLPAEEASVYSSVIRLHVLANSDSERDQQIKLLVRDAVLASGCFDSAGNINDALTGLETAIPQAIECANNALKAANVPYRATVDWGKEQYPTRVYDGVKLPAGTYLSLRIVLGEGEGKNWWCVLFPPMCLGAAADFKDSGKVFSTKTKKYSFRFKLLELFFG